MEDGSFVAEQTVENGDESVSLASRWDTAPDGDII
jgi:hypothetical protein